MRKLLIRAIIGAAIIAAAGCGGKSAAKEAVAAAAADTAAMTELPLPVVPDSLQTVEARAAYVVSRFWDGMDFGGPQAVDTAFVEQNFANFISVLPLAPTECAQAAIDALMRRAAARPAALELLMTTADDYLDDPNSPMRNEEVYILFLKSWVGADYLSDEQRIRPAARLDDAMMNRPGTAAADFDMELRGGGGRTSLSRLVAAARNTLLIFYDPDCHNCHIIMTELAGIPLPEGWQIAAVDSETDRSRWEATAGALPEQWIVAFPAGATAVSDVYALPATPVFYVIDSRGTVVLKDPSPATVKALLQQN